MSLDQPPQTVASALEYGWTHVSVTCPYCQRTGRFDLAKWRGRGSGHLAEFFVRLKCSRCGQDPATTKLAARIDGDRVRWREKRVDFFEGRVIRPSRE